MSRLPATKASQISIRSWRKRLSLCAAAVPDLSELPQQAKSWLKAAEFKCRSSLACLPSSAALRKILIHMALDHHAHAALFKAVYMKRGCFSLCVLPPPSCKPLPISSPPPSSVLCLHPPPPPPLSLSLNRSPFSSDKGGLAVNGLNWHTQMHKLIHHTGAKLHKIDRRPFFISKQFSFIPLRRRDGS